MEIKRRGKKEFEVWVDGQLVYVGNVSEAAAFVAILANDSVAFDPTPVG